MDTEEKNNSKDNLTEEREILISLLNEYSNKLISVCDDIDQHRIRFFSILYLATGILFIFFFASFFVEYRYSVFILSFFVLLCLLVLSIYTFRNQQKTRFLKYKAKNTVIKLEKLVRVTSQFQEHGVESLAKRIELDLRLADAESAIGYYTSIVNAKRGNKNIVISGGTY